MRLARRVASVRATSRRIVRFNSFGGFAPPAPGFRLARAAGQPMPGSGAPGNVRFRRRVPAQAL